jgi:DNA-3-methyladenine glycosylase
MDPSFYRRSAVLVAPDLIGCGFYFHDTGGTIVETEAYETDDPASHSFRGLTVSNVAMFGDAGHAYVYRSYGLHWCFNIVCRRGSAVLIRALQPLEGLEVMRRRRRCTDVRRLCSGPGRLCQALDITIEQNGSSLNGPPFRLNERALDVTVVAGPRIGISKAMEMPWRFGLLGSPYLSRPMTAR